MPSTLHEVFEHVLDVLDSLELDALILEEGRAVKTLISPTPQTQWVCVVECVALEEGAALAAFSRIVLEHESWGKVWPGLLELVNLLNQQVLMLGALEVDEEDRTMSLRTGLVWPEDEVPTVGMVGHVLGTNWSEFELILPAISALLKAPTSSPKALVEQLA